MGFPGLAILTLLVVIVSGVVAGLLLRIVTFEQFLIVVGPIITGGAALLQPVPISTPQAPAVTPAIPPAVPPITPILPPVQPPNAPNTQSFQ